MSCITVYNKLQEVAQYDSESWAEGAVVTLGRNPLTNLPFEHIASLSNHHLSIRKLEGHFYIRDEQSSNGTTANGVPLSYAVRMVVGVTYQAGPLTLFLEDAPLIPLGPDENADSVFPEPYAFALNAPTPLAVEEPVYEQPVEPAYAEPVYEQPAPVVAVEEEEDDCFDLEKMAAAKAQRLAQLAEQAAAPVSLEQSAPVAEYASTEEIAPSSVVDPEPEVQAAPAPESVPVPVAEPTPVVLAAEEDGSFDLEKMAALKKSGASPAAVHMVPQQTSLPQPFLPIGGIPKAGIPQDFRLELSTNDGSLQVREGEALELRVRSSVRCKLILICKDANGTKTMLYPNRYQPGTDIPANTWVRLPEEGTINYEFALEGVGVDTIQAIARLSEGSNLVRAGQAKKGAANKAKAVEKPKSKWAYASIQIEVLPAAAKK